MDDDKIKRTRPTPSFCKHLQHILVIPKVALGHAPSASRGRLLWRESCLPSSHTTTHRAPLRRLVWSRNADRRGSKNEAAGTAETGSRETVFEVKSGPKNWFPIWTQKLVPDLDPKTGSNFGSKTWFPF